MAYVVTLRIWSKEYYEALGRFVVEFTEVEGTLQRALWHISNVKSPVAQAIFSGVRADDASNKITRIGEAENWSEERRAAWKVIADRLGILRTLRNDLLHYGADLKLDGTWVVTNQRYVHAPRKITRTPVTPAILGEATSDLQKLGIHLFHFLYHEAMSSDAARNLEQTLQHAWRYTPPPQATRPKTNPDSGPKRPRPPRPSAASRRKAALRRKAEQSRSE
jgi:hypothetical protein